MSRHPKLDAEALEVRGLNAAASKMDAEALSTVLSFCWFLVILSYVLMFSASSMYEH